MLAADYAHVAPDGKVNMIGGDLGRIFTPSLPAIVPTLTILSKIEWESGDPPQIPLSLSLEGPGGGAVVPPFETTAKRNGEEATVFALILSGLRFDAFGRHRFRLLGSGKELGGVTLDVLQSSPPVGKEL